MNMPYETMFLMPSTSTEEQVNSVVDKLKGTIEKKQGDIMQVQKMGVKKTAYSINKMNSAYYVLFQYEGQSDLPSEIERVLKNHEEVLKYLSTKITTPITKKPENTEAAASTLTAASHEASSSSEAGASVTSENNSDQPVVTEAESKE